MKQTKSKDNSLKQERLKELLQYDYLTGEFTWIAKSSVRGNRVKIGEEAGSFHKKTGYIVITINKQRYRSHRLVWLYHFGVFPLKDIDHIDGNRSNNRIDNLREVSRSENCRNAKMKSNNSSGVTGVSFVEKIRATGKIDKYWLTTWVDVLGNYRQKLFQVAKYGEESAKNLATAFREEKIQELKLLGVDYTPRHGL